MELNWSLSVKFYNSYPVPQQGKLVHVTCTLRNGAGEANYGHIMVYNCTILVSRGIVWNWANVEFIQNCVELNEW